MIAGKPIPEIDVDTLMQEVRVAAPRFDDVCESASSLRILTSGANWDLEDIAGALERIPPSVDPPARIRLSISESDWQSIPAPLPGRKDAPVHFRDFLAYDDDDFVQAAYHTILKRDADDDGLRCYLAMLLDGASKAEILNRIRQSPEARGQNARIGGSRLPFVLDSLSRRPIIGRLIGIAIAIWNLPGAERGQRRSSREIARRLRQSEQGSRRNIETATDALRRLELSQNALADMTTLFATRAQSDALQSALSRTIASLQTLQQATKTCVDKGLFDVQVRELRANIETKADRRESEKSAVAVRASVLAIAEAKAGITDLARVRTAVEAADREIRLIPEIQAALRGLEHRVSDVYASILAVSEAKAGSSEFGRVQQDIDGLARKVDQLQEFKASAVALKNFEVFWLSTAERKAERHEITALTNHLVALLEDRATKQEFDLLRSSIAKTNDVIESVRVDKADINYLDRLSTEMKRESRVGFENVEARVRGLADTKADHTAMAALRLELGVTINESTATSTEVLQGLRNELQRTLDALAHSKADQASLSALCEELITAVGESAALASGALQDFKDRVEIRLESVDQSKAVQAAIVAFRSEMIAALETSTGATKTAFLESIANMDRELESLRQSTVDQADVAALRLELGSAIEESRVAASGALQASKSELERVLHAAKAALLGSVADMAGRLDQLVAQRANLDAAEGVKAEVNQALAANQKGAIDSLTSALAVVNSQAHDLKRNVLDQDRRVGLLLEEARKRFPKPMAAAQIGAMLAEEDHRLDAMYASLEDQFRGTRTDIRQRQAVYLPYVREAKAGTARAPVIDIGCGRGEWLELLRDEGFNARGVDLNRIFLDGCRELGLDVCEQDALSFLRQLKRDSVGLVTSFHVIEHLDHKVLISLLDEALRVLRPGGIAIFETPNPLNVVVGSCNFYLDPTHKRPLPPDLSRYLLEARGFSRVEVLDLHPCREEQMISEGARQVRDALNHMLHSFQDYAVIGRKA
jgi:SAM-dependent methyltransferase